MNGWQHGEMTCLAAREAAGEARSNDGGSARERVSTSSRVPSQPGASASTERGQDPPTPNQS